MALLDEYKFTVTPSGGGVSRQVYPRLDRVLFRDQKQGQGPFFKKEIATDLIFTGDDFVYFYGIYNTNPCRSFTLTVEQRDTGAGAWLVVLRSRIGLGEATYDPARNIVIFKPLKGQMDKCFRTAMKQKQNILALAPSVNVRTLVGVIEEEICANEVPLAAFDGTHIQDCIPGGAITNKWAMVNHDEYITNTTPDGLMQTVTIWQRERWNKPGSPLDIETWTDIGGTLYRPIRVFGSSVSTIDSSYSYTGHTAVYGEAERNRRLDGGRRLNTVITGLVSAINCDITVVSNFLNINPDSTAPGNLPYFSAFDYLHDLLIYQRTDIMRIEADENATKLEWSLEDVLKMLEAFNTFWYIDPVDNGPDILRIEHVSYRGESQQNDFTLPDYAAFVREHTKFTTSARDNVPPFEQFTIFGGRLGTYFSSARIQYNPECVGGEEPVNYDFLNFATDFEGQVMADSASDTGDGAFLMSTCKYDNVLYMLQHGNNFNGILSWRYILEFFWRYDRPQRNGTVVYQGGLPSDPIVSQTVRPNREADPIRVPVTRPQYRAFNAQMLQKTPLGWGRPDEATYDSKTGILEIKLRYSTP